MKNKIFVIVTIALFPGVMLLTSIDAQPINNLFQFLNQPQLTVKKEISFEQTCYNNCRVFGIGLCYGISINGDIKQGQGRNQHLFGLINADLSIRNQDPILFNYIGAILSYSLKVKDPQTGETYKKDALPVYIYLDNFRGIGYINDYYKPWGPTCAIFFLYGTADYIV